MNSIRTTTSLVASLTLVAALTLPLTTALAAAAPPDAQARAQRVVVAATSFNEAPFAAARAPDLDAQAQAGRTMIAPTSFGSHARRQSAVSPSRIVPGHRPRDPAVGPDAQESARRMMSGGREGV